MGVVRRTYVPRVLAMKHVFGTRELYSYTPATDTATTTTIAWTPRQQGRQARRFVCEIHHFRPHFSARFLFVLNSIFLLLLGQATHVVNARGFRQHLRHGPRSQQRSSQTAKSSSGQYVPI